MEWVTLVLLFFFMVLVLPACIFSALDIAIYTASPTLVKSVLRLGADPTRFSVQGMQSLSEPAFREILAVLLEGKADVNDWRGGGQMLHRIDYRRNNAVACLIEKGANVNSCDTMLNTPLFFAVRAGAEESVHLLLEAKANPSYTKYYYASHRSHLCGGTPLDIACRRKASESMLRRLSLAGAESAACHQCRRRNSHHQMFHRISWRLREPQFPASLPACLVDLIQRYIGVKVDIVRK